MRVDGGCQVRGTCRVVGAVLEVGPLGQRERPQGAVFVIHGNRVQGRVGLRAGDGDRVVGASVIRRDHADAPLNGAAADRVDESGQRRHGRVLHAHSVESL